MFCPTPNVVTGKTELSGPKMNCVREGHVVGGSWRKEMWSAGGVRQDHPWSHPRDHPRNLQMKDWHLLEGLGLTMQDLNSLLEEMVDGMVLDAVA